MFTWKLLLFATANRQTALFFRTLNVQLKKKQQKIPLCFYYLFSTCVKALEKSIYHVIWVICMCVRIIFSSTAKSMRNKNEFILSCQNSMRFPLESENELVMSTILLLFNVYAFEYLKEKQPFNECVFVTCVKHK